VPCTNRRGSTACLPAAGYPARVTNSQLDLADRRRHDGRTLDQLRPGSFVRDFTEFAAGSVLAVSGRTKVLCTASVDEDVPRWMRGTGRGWVTAEYSLLPGSSPERVSREATKGRQSGRTQEIQRAISGAYVALHDACSRLCASGRLNSHPVREACAAVSVGVVDKACMLDLDYVEDSSAQVDMNVVMTSSGCFVEVQGTAEGPPFPRAQLDEMLALAEGGIAKILAMQSEVLASPPQVRS